MRLDHHLSRLTKAAAAQHHDAHRVQSARRILVKRAQHLVLFHPTLLRQAPGGFLPRRRLRPERSGYPHFLAGWLETICYINGVVFKSVHINLWLEAHLPRWAGPL